MAQEQAVVICGTTSSPSVTINAVSAAVGPRSYNSRKNTVEYLTVVKMDGTVPNAENFNSRRIRTMKAISFTKQKETAG